MADLSYGTTKEMETKPVLEKFLNTELVVKGGFHPFDFHNKTNTVYLELKSRRFNHDKYPTTMIGLNKVEYAKKNPGCDYWFAYNFEDGVWAVKYDPALFDSFEVKTDFRRSYRADCANYNQRIVYIPIANLTKIL